MPVYFCGVCQYTTESKSSMDRHAARKRPCTVKDRPVQSAPGVPATTLPVISDQACKPG